jgi:hypothetical protein
MGKLSAQGRESGMLVAGGQLGGADASARVRLAAGKIGVSEGPFPETKEVIGGYAILEYADKKAALEGCVAALDQWPSDGVPSNPGAWLMAAAKHRAIANGNG